MLGDFFICPPSSFQLLGHTFYWYGVIIACGFLLAVAYCWVRAPRFGVRPEDMMDVLLFAVPLAIVGARVYYVAFYGGYDSFWDMCKIWEGGLAIYGGLLAAVITVFAVCRVKKISALAMLDVAAPGLLIGQAVGRWGNFINREAFGYETAVFCRMGLTAGGQTIYVHPTFLYESLWNLVGLVLLHLWTKHGTRKFDGEHFLFYLGWYGLGRAWIEGLRADSLYLWGSGLRVSQVVAALTVAAAAGVMAAVLVWGQCKPEKLWVNRRAEGEAD
jgi:phosphatidylglycerol:prolipoprotein diacylglycerol transferase